MARTLTISARTVARRIRHPYHFNFPSNDNGAPFRRRYRNPTLRHPYFVAKVLAVKAMTGQNLKLRHCNDGALHVFFAPLRAPACGLPTHPSGHKCQTDDAICEQCYNEFIAWAQGLTL